MCHSGFIFTFLPYYHRIYNANSFYIIFHLYAIISSSIFRSNSLSLSLSPRQNNPLSHISVRCKASLKRAKRATYFPVPFTLSRQNTVIHYTPAAIKDSPTSPLLAVQVESPCVAAGKDVRGPPVMLLLPFSRVILPSGPRVTCWRGCGGRGGLRRCLTEEVWLRGVSC